MWTASIQFFRFFKTSAFSSIFVYVHFSKVEFKSPVYRFSGTENLITRKPISKTWTAVVDKLMSSNTFSHRVMCAKSFTRYWWRSMYDQGMLVTQSNQNPVTDVMLRKAIAHTSSIYPRSSAYTPTKNWSNTSICAWMVNQSHLMVSGIWL